MAKHALRPAVVDLRRLAGSANGAAYARAAALHTSMGFERFDRSSVVNFLAEAITSEPGLAVINQDVRAIDKDRQVFAANYLRDAIAASARGLDAFAANVTRMDQDRRLNLARVNTVFNQTARTNSQIEARLTLAMHTLSVIKFGATVSLAVIPLAPIFIAGIELSAVASLAISLGYGLAQTAIMDHERDAPPNVVAFDISGELGKAARDGGVEIGSRVAHQSVAANNNLLADAQQQIETLSRRLARDLAPAKNAQLLRRLDRSESAADQASRALRGAKVASGALHSIPIVFAVMDIHSAAEELKKEW